MPNKEEMKDFTVATKNLIDSFEKLSGTMSNEDKEMFQSVFGGDGAVGLRDTDKFSVAIDIISSEEIQNMRREIASAIATENYVKGAMMAFKIITMLGGM